jgi:hypothetical protein
VCQNSQAQVEAPTHAAKTGLDVEKLANSPIRAETLTNAKMQGGYHHSKTSILGASFSTPQGMAEDRLKAHGSITMAEGHNGQK